MPPRSFVPSLNRTNIRLVCFGLSAVGAIYLGFLAVGFREAERIIMKGGYYVMVVTLLLWLRALWQVWRSPANRSPAWPPGERVALVALVLGCCTVAVVQETFRCKILYDEYVLQSTAFNMHFFREVGVMVRGYDLMGTFISTDNYLDKRPYFFPFLVSLVHDVTGYRSANAYAVNVVLLPVALGLVYWLGRRVAGWRGGILATALLGTLPVLVQNATGSGMELINITMLLATLALGVVWLERPDESRLDAFVISAVLLAQCRYESALYVLPTAFLILIGWWRRSQVVLSWPTIMAPLLMVPVAMHNLVLSHSPVLWEMKDNQSSRFGVEYVAGNLQGARDFFFSTDWQKANSPLLAVLGGFALLWLAGWLVWRICRPGKIASGSLAWLLFGAAICVNTVLIMFYFWSSFADPMAARFSLPFWVLLTFAVVLMVRSLDGRMPATPGLLLLAGMALLGSSIPRQAHHHYSHLGSDEIDWELRLVDSLPTGDRLVITNKSTLPWLLEKTPSILISRARLLSDRLRFQLTDHLFREILITQSLRPTTVNGSHEVVPEDELPPGFKVELVAEKRFGTKLARISRLLAVEGSQPLASR